MITRAVDITFTCNCMRSEVLQKIIDETPDEVKIFVDKYTDLVIRINQILHEKGYTQKSLAGKILEICGTVL